MRSVLLSLLLASCIHSLSAQFSENNALYLSTETNFGNYFGLDLQLNYLLDYNWSFNLGFTGGLRTPTSLPQDYDSGLFGALFLGLAEPHDELVSLRLGGGKIYKLNKSGSIRANLTAGVGYTMINEPDNWQRSGSDFFDENYTYDRRKFNTVSLILNPKFEFPLISIYGLTVSPFAHLNKHRSSFGIGFGQMIGVLRP